MRRLRSVLVSWLFFLPSLGQAKVIVHISYVEREADQVLQTLLRDHPGKPVLIVADSYQIQEQRIFRRPLEFFGDGAPLSVTHESPKVLGLSKGPSDEFADLQEVRVQGPALKEGQEAQKLEDVVVVLTPPKTGRDPASVKKFLDLTLDALSKLPEAELEKGGLEIRSFGSAGGVLSDLPPGYAGAVDSSLFIGAEEIPSTQPKRYRGIISFSDLKTGDSGDVEFFRSSEFGSKAEAEQAAEAAFVETIECVFREPTHCAASEFDEVQRPLCSAYGNLMRSSLGGMRSSLTASFFVSPRLKALAQKLGIRNANMEDFHVIQKVNELKQQGVPVSKVVVNRIIADPPTLSKETQRAVRTWIASAKYSTQSIEDVLLWGLRGQRPSEAPDSIYWHDLQKLGPEFKDIPASPFDPLLLGVAGQLIDRVSDSRFLCEQTHHREIPPQDCERKRLRVKLIIDRLKKEKGASVSDQRTWVRSLVHEVWDGSNQLIVPPVLTRDVIGFDAPSPGVLSEKLESPEAMDRFFYKVFLNSFTVMKPSSE